MSEVKAGSDDYRPARQALTRHPRHDAGGIDSMGRRAGRRFISGPPSRPVDARFPRTRKRLGRDSSTTWSGPRRRVREAPGGATVAKDLVGWLLIALGAAGSGRL